MDIEKLKQKILDLAIRGKLVPQDPNDEPASVLIEKIRNEKEELIKQGKIKRDKNESYIYKGSDNCYYEKIGNEVRNIIDEIPFEIPINWCWCRLNELGQFRKGPFGSSLTKEMFVAENTPNRIKVYEQKNAIQKNSKLGKYYITYEKFLTMESFKVEPEDIIVSCAGTIGEIYILPTDSELGIINQALMRIKLYYKNITNYFLMYFDFVLKKEANEKGNGTGMKNIPPFDILKKMLVPLPPINEMNKIISKLDILLAKCDNISLETNSLNSTINQIKQKILDYFFGENSCYKSYFMNKNKEYLKNFIPSKYIGDGDWVLSENMDPNGDYKLIQLKHIGNNQYLNKPYNTVNKQFVNQNNCSIITSGTLLINRLVADRMNCCILPETTNNHITSVDVCWIAKNNSIDNEYLMYLLSSPSFQTKVMNKCSGSTRKRISKKNLLDIKVFIHNYEYQLIIKTKIHEIFCLLDSINI